jgi:hypothetical protein
MKNSCPHHDESRHGLRACRRRLRRSRVIRHLVAKSSSRAQTANRESTLLASEFDRHAPRRARFETREEADVT